MNRLRLNRLVQLGVLMITVTSATRAWSQSSSTQGSLADRIRELRGGAGTIDTSSSDDASNTGPIPDQSTPRPRPSSTSQSSSTNSSGLPQINAKSLIPFNLFGRPTASAGDATEPQPMPGHKPATAAVKKTPANSSQPSDEQPTPRGRVGSALNSNTYGQTASPSAPSTSVAKPATDKLPVVKPQTSVAAASPARGSPEQRAPINFDPETLRNDLAGAFPAPGHDDHSAANSSANSNSSDDETGPIGHSAARPSPQAHVDQAPSHVSKSDLSADSTSDSSKPFPTVGELLGRRAAEAKVKRAESEPAIGSSDPDTRDAGAKAFEPSASPRTIAAKPAPVVMTPVKSSDSAAGHFTTDKEQDAARPDGNAVLSTNRAPAVVSEMEGPKQIMIGRDACYHLLLRNEGSSIANDFTASINIPFWADVVSTSATKGVVRLPQNTDAKSQGTLDWQIEKLDPQAAETLTIHLVPHESRPLELGVTLTHAAVGSKAVVEVQEPKLKIQIAGPDEVLFGKSQVYRLTLTNPGTGPAENVKIDLMPPGGNETAVSTHKLGNLAPGTSKSVEVELTARQAGKLNIKADASAEGGLASDATKEIFCRKPELEADWRGPDSQYAGTTATYYFRVRNPGTATAEDVTVRVALPDGANFISASDGQVYDPDRREVAWRVGSLRPGDDCYTELKCTVNNPGKNQLHMAAATGAGDLTDSKIAVTNVVGLADLKLDIKDPPGPLPIGQEAVYEINIFNRGNNAAQDVNVVALFSDGLEPAAVEGGQYSVSDGRVSFHGIDKIPAGQTVTLRVHAKAMKPGTHVFRAEVLCKDLEIKLAAEETTRFYQDEVAREESAASAPKVGAKDSEPALAAMSQQLQRTILADFAGDFFVAQFNR